MKSDKINLRFIFKKLKFGIVVKYKASSYILIQIIKNIFHLAGYSLRDGYDRG